MLTIYEADRVISPGAELADGADAVLVAGACIEAVGRSADLLAGHPAADVRGFPGASIMPGLIDSHVHLVADTTTTPFTTAVSGTLHEVRALARRNATASLRSGVTTVRDLGDTRGIVAELRDERRDTAVPASPRPRILSAGMPLTITGGHCWYLGGVADTADELRTAIDRAAPTVDLIKVMAGGGYLTTGGPGVFDAQYSTDLLTAVVDHAAQHGLPVAAHAHGSEPIIRCIDAGVATIEHCGWRSGPARRNWDNDQARAMAERNIAAGTTTPAHWRTIADMITNTATATGEDYQFGAQITWMDTHGVPILIGTDAGTPQAVFDNLRTSAELFEQLRFTPERIIDLLTTHAARQLGLAEKTGAVRPGLDADLLIVNGDPRTDLDVLHRPELVIAHGVAYTQDQLTDPTPDTSAVRNSEP
ncbi:Xaa-Pro dipeptidase [Pseudonocardia sp. Ae406_Ps2]|uniref:amidohydrolase family protein n=1 Tax=unclassified Pseudonocardia TaxID=2619320 RepID=UPI00095C89D6|nr:MULTISPECIES: amidohydrolase family protein [unclassified Pseudonocardia]OLL89533.1 Xaa-Pro dipeptidase [Pseudonocardia sp. Ae331_Ps2]OLL89984.1 Xaa-Pro dipeptidase [Pseudonocardia sp. Ae406_Ps2]OLM08724.1 Xaa-Pro dipeptidase [Pseudonocardia sp. Ae706_Ps2]